MNRYMGNKPAAQPKNGSQVWIGIVIGMVIGAGMATIFTWYMVKSPSPFLKNNPVADAIKSLPPATTQAADTPKAAEAPEGSSAKPRFEFYNVLTEKKGAERVAPARQTEKTRLPGSKPAAAYIPQILQVGSFSNAGDAEKLKVRLALIGAEAHLETANVPDKGVYYRVRLGPYQSEEEMNRARSFLKQNGMDSTPMRAK